MKNMDEIISENLSKQEISINSIPNIDLYMDQILTFLTDHMPEKKYDKENLLTKSMINNYTKEKILSPVKGKKYTKDQIVQLLCIMNLKQNLSLSEIKFIFQEAEKEETFSIQEIYSESIRLKSELQDFLVKDFNMVLENKKNEISATEALTTILAFSSLATFLKNISQEMICNFLENECSL